MFYVTLSEPFVKRQNLMEVVHLLNGLKVYNNGKYLMKWKVIKISTKYLSQFEFNRKLGLEP